MSRILAGDIGGTKTNLALYEMVGDVLVLQSQYQYVSRSFTSFSDILCDFKNRFVKAPIDLACLGVAGPVIDGHCRTTNLPWKINALELKKQLNTTKVCLLNDLEATAYGMLMLHDDEFVELTVGRKRADGNCAVIAAGTGLGEAILFWDGDKFHPIGTEGGHSDFAPCTQQQDDLLRWLRQHYPKHVSVERILSGSGIVMLYEFLGQCQYAPQSALMIDPSEELDRSALISEGALVHKDPLCIETLRLFVEIYGAEAGNLALKSMALGGIYIGGGIAPKILSALSDNNTFLNAFIKKGRFEEMLRGISVKVSLNPQTALLGAAHFAFDRL